MTTPHALGSVCSSPNRSVVQSFSTFFIKILALFIHSGYNISCSDSLPHGQAVRQRILIP
ncbi:hypothetical protein NBRC111894_2247 [Sporolactobacillus inulinus]|uniref:Uncharacterized protein n=1 Tax=Sporolactobacillus inulinus TaxID=2078 RepID=A0A4Y1ZCK6_9BACL|nr:hypothetical protein NBRC111894_2247 [Sporolactobacillus inulinus]